MISEYRDRESVCSLTFKQVPKLPVSVRKVARRVRKKKNGYLKRQSKKEKAKAKGKMMKYWRVQIVFFWHFFMTTATAPWYYSVCFTQMVICKNSKHGVTEGNLRAGPWVVDPPDAVWRTDTVSTGPPLDGLHESTELTLQNRLFPPSTLWVRTD